MVRQIQDLCRKKYKRGFSKKALSRIEGFFFVLGSYESLEGLER